MGGLQKYRQVKIRGFRVELAAIEASLTKNTSVQQAAVIASEQNTLSAFVIPSSPESVNEQRLLNELKLDLPHYMIPERITIVLEFPRLGNGKIDFNNLKSSEVTAQQVNEVQFITPRDEVELGISQIWQEVLKVENIRIFALNSRGKIKENEFKARYINKLRIDFNIAENNLAPIEGKDIMIRIVGPDDNVLFDVATGSGTFMFRGREEFYTARQQILFDNTMQKLSFDYDKGSEWATGRYELEVYNDDYIMGERAFMVK